MRRHACFGLCSNSLFHHPDAQLDQESRKTEQNKNCVDVEDSLKVVQGELSQIFLSLLLNLL